MLTTITAADTDTATELATRKEQLAEQVQAAVTAAKAENTRRAYQSDADQVAAWFTAEGQPWTAEALAAYLADLGARGAAVATIERRLVSARWLERSGAAPAGPASSGLVKETMAGLRRLHGAQQDAAPPFVIEHLRAYMYATAAATDARTLRDRALVAVGFATAARRSELVAITADDLRRVDGGLELTIRRSKTDQSGAGHVVPIPRSRDARICPVAALDAWTAAAGIDAGPVFTACTKSGRSTGKGLSGFAVSGIVKSAAAIAGATDPESYSGHSLRAGLATSAAAAGLAERDIMATTGHKSLTMVRRYIRDGERWTNSVAAALI